MNPTKNNQAKNSSGNANSSANSKPGFKIKLNKADTKTDFDNVDLKSDLENLKNRNQQTEVENNPEAEQNQSSVTDSTVENLYYQIEELKLTLENTKKESEEIKLIAQRAVADSTNLAHQHQLDLESNQKSLKKSVAGHILHVINTLYLAFLYAPATEDEKVIKYLETIKQSFEKSLEDLKVVGIEILTAHKGDSIDFTTMNIINSPENAEDPKVSQVVSLGLRIDNQVVQPVTVMV